jgi:photosystem II stability/assembly factor-like uncharacterized protein
MEYAVKVRAARPGRVRLRGAIAVAAAAAVLVGPGVAIGGGQAPAAPRPDAAGRGASDEEIARRRGVDAKAVERLRKNRTPGAPEILRLSDDRLRAAIRELDAPDNPANRAEFRRRSLHGLPGGSAVDWRRVQEYQQSLRKNWKGAPRVGGLPVGGEVSPAKLVAPLRGPRPGEISPGGWVWLGPGNLGGRTRSFLVHPGDPSVMWAGSVSGGIWKTTDAGRRWAPVDDFMASLAVTCMVMDPRSPSTIYAGTGESYIGIGGGAGFVPDGTLGAGVFRTTDGTHWLPVPRPSASDFSQINRLAAARGDDGGTVLLAATPQGIWRSTRDTRDDWQQARALDAHDPLGGIASLEFSPADPKRVVAGALVDGRAFLSSDGGLTWTRAALPGTLGRVELTHARKDPSIVYASTYLSVAGAGHASRLFRSRDGGRTYAEMKTRRQDDPGGAPVEFLGPGGQGVYANVIWAGDPTSADLVIVGGINLWRSRDGGDSLEMISAGESEASAHSDHHVIVADARYNGSTNRAAYFGNDGGLYRADDVATVGSDAAHTLGWSPLNNEYGVTQFYGAAGDGRSGVIVGGAQDLGLLAYHPAAGPNAWRSVAGGDGGYCAVDPPGDGSRPASLYGAINRLDILRSTDGGRTWDLINGKTSRDQGPPWKASPFRIDDAMNGQVNIIAPFVLDPNQPERILAGGLSLWRTNDARAALTDQTGPAWSAIKAPISDETAKAVTAIAVARGDSNVIWVGYGNGEVWRTSNGTADQPTWIPMDHLAGGPLPDRFCTRVVIDASDTKRVYALFGGFFPDNVWTFREGDPGWTALQGLPPAPVRALTGHPDHPDILYVGSELGVLVSVDRGVSWIATNEGPTNCAVDELFWMGKSLVAVTYGRGLYRIDLSAPMR